METAGTEWPSRSSRVPSKTGSPVVLMKSCQENGVFFGKQGRLRGAPVEMRPPWQLQVETQPRSDFQWRGDELLISAGGAGAATLCCPEWAWRAAENSAAEEENRVIPGRWHLGMRPESIALETLQIGADVSRVLIAQIAILLQASSMTSSNRAGKSGFRRTGATGARRRIESNTAAEVSPRKGSVPVAISWRTLPKEKRSVRVSNSLPRVCSGDMYATVPSVVLGLVRCCSSIVRVSPSADIWLETRTAMPPLSPKSRILACTAW